MSLILPYHFAVEVAEYGAWPCLFIMIHTLVWYRKM